MRFIPMAVAVLVLTGAARLHAGGTCEVDGDYGVRSKTTVDGKRLTGLSAGRWPNGQRVVNVLADGGDGNGTLQITAGYLSESTSGRWRVSTRVVTDQPALELRLKRCERFVGRIKPAGKRARRLVAERVRCGDGHVDRFAGEDCEGTGSAGCAAGTCTSACTCHGSSGQADPTFGDAGVVTIDVGGEPPLTPCPPRQGFCFYTQVSGLVAQSDGRMLVVGRAPRQSGGASLRDGFLYRLAADGALDPTLVGTGPFYGDARVAPIDDGRLAVAYPAQIAPWHQAVRLLPDGAQDPSFLPGIPRNPGDVTAVAGAPDGTIVVLGDDEITVWREDATWTTTDLPDGWTASTLDASGGIVAHRSAPTVALGRFTNDGLLDPTFGDGGVACIASAGTFDGVNVLNDRSLAVGVRIGEELHIVVVPPGASGFDHDCASTPAATVMPALPVLRQSDGKYLAVHGFRVIRLLTDGALDLDFARLGVLDAAGAPTAVALDTEGRIVVGSNSVRRELIVRRYLP